MKYACEIAKMVEEKKRKEEEEKQRAYLECLAKKMEEYQKNLPSIDKYVEENLVAGNGIVELMYDFTWDGFAHFSKKSNDYDHCLEMPFWTNTRVTEDFPIEIYIAYLKEHGFTVEETKHPFMASSSTGKTQCRKPGLCLKISV